MNALKPDQIQRLREAVKIARAKHQRAVAAFDADGTLWNTDLGEALFDYQVRNKLLKGLPDDPWKHYEDLKVEQSHEVAYLWLAQINKGLPLQQVQTWAQTAVDEMAPVPVFKEVKALIKELHDLGAEVYIVTASIQWAVEPGAPLLGIPRERVIGIRTRVDKGIVTDLQEGPITYKSGKVKGLLEATGGAQPFFCAGNTEGDLPLLESSSDLRLVIAGSPPSDRNFKTEQFMLNIAKERGWFAQNYLGPSIP